MAVDIDGPPVYDQLVDDSKMLSSTWNSWFASHIETITEYLSQYGLFIPKLTTVQRNTITNPQNGQMIYNTTLNKFQGYENGAWTNFI